MFPYQNSQLDTEQRIADLLARMTLEEKAGQLLQLPAHNPEYFEQLEEMHIGSYLHCTDQQMHQLQQRAANTRLGIPLIFGIDAIHGHCLENDTTVFPTQLATSCSWDAQLHRDMAEATAKEVRACGHHWTFSPVLCVARDARWGRVSETYGEDPWLIGELAAATIEGYQGEQIGGAESILACAKHYVGYGDTLGGRDSYEGDTSKRKLLSTFLPPFEKAVKQANCASLMTGYHSMDGVPATNNSWLLRDVAKDDWGLEGFIVTDWENVTSLHTKQGVAESRKHASYLALAAGNDMMMSSPHFYQDCVELVNEGQLDIALVNDAVARILRMKFKLGLFDEQRFADVSKKAQVIGNDAHWDLSLQASRKSMVLLKNDGILPLESDRLQRVLLVGPNCDDVVAQLGDWSFGSMQAGAADDSFHREDTTTVLDAFKLAAERYGFQLDYLKGADCVDAEFNEISEAVELAKQADLVVACVGDTLRLNGEFHDRAMLDLTGQQQALLEAVQQTGTPLVVNYIASKPLTIPWIKEHANALLCAFNPGCKGGQAIVETLFGEINPSGKLTISFPHHVGQLPVYYNKFQGWHAQNSQYLDGQERYIDLPMEPLFAFGEGLQYTTYRYQDMQLSASELRTGEVLTVSVEVSNTGERDGEEIVQLYFNDIYSSVTTPIQNLCAYQKVSLKAGESKRVSLSLAVDELYVITPELEKRVENGDFEVMVGGSSKPDSLLCKRFTVVG
ncbi:glycoside hydrolase family 3 N-terminal domain-containing protein [Aliagarivorans taiwanensis]|uniref:glycoside hydrolase family 3 N-terminal domain-containing protein n=1 Tax=Aliagarivorans taiwanensis TaxID=561966 RepID=UPI000411AE63|nr:glycoside hydrolase family 3 N-terminal domain-containing protein [Aliagarivorans taiwanensis]